MDEQDLQKLKSVAKSLRRLNNRIKLVALLEKAKKEYEMNKLAECEKTCLEILKTDSQNSIALRGLGCVMQTRGELEQALNYYNQALEFSKNKEVEYTLIGTLYYNEDKLDDAIKYFNLAIEINDSYDLSYEGRNQSMLENHLQILDLQDSLIKRNMFK